MLYHKCRCGKNIPQEQKLCANCEKTNKSRHTEYDKKYRNKENANVYSGKTWRTKVRPHIMQIYQGFDLYLMCKAHRLVNADMVHHIIEVSEDYSKRYEFSNLIPLTNKTHAFISKIYEQGGEPKRRLQRELSEMVKLYTQGGMEKIFSNPRTAAHPLICGENSPREIPDI